MKTRFTTDCAGRVTISYDEAVTGYRLIREFVCPFGGGYVRERRGNDWQQVCAKLECRGPTLSCESRDKLIALIRAEYRAMRRAEKQLFCEY